MEYKLSSAYEVLSRAYEEKAKRLARAADLAKRDELVDEFVDILIRLSRTQDCIVDGKVERRYIISSRTLRLIADSFKKEGR